jgi:hypothetical protein
LIEVRPVTNEDRYRLADSKFYALTGDHNFTPDTTSLDSSEVNPFDTEDKDLHNEAEAALIIDEWQPDGQKNLIISETLTQNADSTATINTLSIEMSGEEWALMNVEDPLLRLPNAIEESAKFRPVSSEQTYDISKEYKKPCYIGKFADKPVDTNVVVVTGTSGLQLGRLSRHDSSLHLSGSRSFLTVWIVDLGHCKWIVRV